MLGLVEFHLPTKPLLGLIESYLEIENKNYFADFRVHGEITKADSSSKFTFKFLTLEKDFLL